MHELEQDPDVIQYIHAEANYTNAWLENSHTKQIVDQIDREQQAIMKSIAEQDYLRGAVPVGLGSIDESKTAFLYQSQDEHGLQTQAPQDQRLEGTKFWDVDTWRYWLDGSKGDYGIYLRRKIPLQPKQLEQERDRLAVKRAAMGKIEPSTGLDHQKSSTASDPELPKQPVIQIVLDVDKLQRERERRRPANQFSFGMLEIQPRSTILEPRSVDLTSSSGLAPPDTILAAYSYDTTGDERYTIRIMTLAEDPRQWRQSQEPADMGYGSIVLKNAGVGSRWVRIGDSLYLYYTQIDSRGLQREVWRVCVQTIDPELGHVVHQKPQSELVMREENSQLVLGVTQTNDLQYLLIESSGQTTSHTFFLDLNDPSANWTLVRKPEDGVLYSVEHHTGFFYIRTNNAGNENFEVIRVPLSAYKSADDTEQAVQSSYSSLFSGGDQQDEKVIPHSADEFLERFEVYVDHFVTWVWRKGMQEIRIFDALKTSINAAAPKLPIKERQRLQPWRKDTQVATVLPGCIRGEDDRLYRNYFATALQFCNSSFIRPWALYEYDMNAPPAIYGHIGDEDDEIINNATTLICQEPFPIGVTYGQPSPQSELFPEQANPASAVDQETFSAEDTTHTSSSCEIDSSIMDLKQRIFSAPNWRQKCTTSAEHTTEAMGPSSSLPKLAPQDGFSKSRLAPLRQPKSTPATTAMEPNDRRNRQEHEMAKFTEKRLMVPSSHTPNISIPVSLVYYDFQGRNFPRPAFVQAYGAYGSMYSADFNPLLALPLLHRGLIYVQVYPRGDGVLGPQWYRDGKLEHKINTFYDVEDVLLHLKQSGMVMPGGCAIEGRSAGGLISGWFANRWGETTFDSTTANHGDTEPKSNIVREMVNVVLAQVPFLDVVSGMADKDIPWVEYEWTEWGNPADSIEMYKAMMSYSPYDRIRTQPYPAMMVMGGLSDSRVSYAEPLKFVTKLRSIDGKTNDCQEHKKEPQEGGDEDKDERRRPENVVDEKPKRSVNDRMCGGKGETPLLLQIEEGGHFSGSSALWMGFALSQLGATKVETPQS